MNQLFAQRVYDAALAARPMDGINFYIGGPQEYVFFSYRSFWSLAQAFGARYGRAQTGRRKVVLIATQSPYATLIAFIGAVSTGALPMVLPGPKALGGWQGVQSSLNYWVDRCGIDCCVVLENGTPHLLLGDETEVHCVDTTLASPHDEPSLAPPPPLLPDALAFLQMTSASTGPNKVVAVTQANVCANLEALYVRAECGPDEKISNWLPLYHDMGLIGAVLFSFYHGYPLYVMSPTDFLKRPARWLQTISKHRCTLTGGPNFGFEYAVRHIRDEEMETLDFSHLKMALIGAEPVRHATVSKFLERFAPAGLRAESIVPSYGLAESTVCATMGSNKIKPIFSLIDLTGVTADSLVPCSEAISLQAGAGVVEDKGRIGVFSVGTPIDGVHIELVNEAGQVFSEDGRLGELRLTGPCIVPGYFDPEEQSVRRFGDDGMLTGDLGFILDGEVYILERKKNLIIRNGQNFFSALIERSVAALLHGASENVIVIESSIHTTEPELIAIVEDWKEDAIPANAVAALRGLELRIDKIMFFRQRVIPRTTSGKKRYFECRQELAEGRLKPDSQIDLWEV